MRNDDGDLILPLDEERESLTDSYARITEFSNTLAPPEDAQVMTGVDVALVLIERELKSEATRKALGLVRQHIEGLRSLQLEQALVIERLLRSKPLALFGREVLMILDGHPRETWGANQMETIAECAGEHGLTGLPPCPPGGEDDIDEDYWSIYKEHFHKRNPQLVGVPPIEK